MTMGGMWALLPIKETTQAKQRLAGVLSPDLRRQLALTMAEEVLAALSAVPALAGVAVITVDRAVGALAKRYGARILSEGARDGHTGAVRSAVNVLAGEGVSAVLQVPGDIPLITPAEVETVMA